MARRDLGDSLHVNDEMRKVRGLNLPSRLVEGVLLLEFMYHLVPGPRRQAAGGPPS